MQIDTTVLDAHFRSLQQRFHPDNFATAAAAEKQLSVLLSSRLNDAYAILKKPLKRAAYMVSLMGKDVYSEKDSIVSPEFLEQQIEWREALETVLTADEKMALRNDVEQHHTQIMVESTMAIDKKEIEAAYQSVRQWIYIDKILSEINKHGIG